MMRMRWRRMAMVPEGTTAGQVVLTGENLGLSYGDNEVLKGVDVQVRAGEVLALVGPNGAGKSTLLSVLSGDQLPSTGQVSIGGEPVSHWTLVELAQRRAVLLQQVQLSFPFTVAEVVRMGRAPWRDTEAEEDDDAIVVASMEETDVAQFSHRRFTSLSGGEKSRAALSRVLAQQAGVMLLDEPTAALDIRHQEQVLLLARQRAQAGDAVVVVMHDLGLAAAYADQVLVLANGQVAAAGTPAEVMTAELLSRVYQWPVEVFRHPVTDRLVVLPERQPLNSPLLATKPELPLGE